ncbi:MAG: glycosyltransferase family 4 protein [Ruminococcus sp.]|nr:glycosyltransferase family 4 protein [Ruminococcus sp.]
MNILYIATYEGLSGASFSLLGLVLEMQKQKNNVHVVLLKDGKLKKLLEENHVPYTIVKGYPWVIRQRFQSSLKKRILWYIKKICNRVAERSIQNLICNEKFDIVHINASTAGVGAIAAKKAGIPVVWHIREFVEEDLEKVFLDKEESLSLISQSDAVIAISQSVYQKFYPLMTDANFHVIYNGIDQKSYLAGRTRLLFSEKIVKITIAGRIDPAKGHMDLLKAAFLLKQDGYTDFCIQIAGVSQNAAYEQSLKAFIKEKQMEDMISFLGFCTNLPAILLDSDISVVSSRMEAFGRVTVESMMAGNVVVGADSGGTSELLQNQYGILYECGSAESLAEQLRYVLTHREKMAETANIARKYALFSFTSEKNAADILNLYHQLKFGGAYHE